MAISADQYVTQAILDDSRYVQGGRRIVKTTQDIDDAEDKLSKKTRSLHSDFDKIWQLGERAVQTATRFVGALGAVGGALIALSAYSLKAYGDIDALERAVAAIDGSAAKAKQRIIELKDLARAPGLGFKESIEAYIKFRGAGAGEGLSKELIRESANANARAGGDRSSFDRIILALSQMLSRGRLEGDEARQLAEARIPIYDILKRRFGTSDTAELAQRGIGTAEVVPALLEEWKQLERVSGGFKNSLENLQDASERAAASLGEGLVGSVLAVQDDLAKAVEKLTDSGVFKNLGQTLGQQFQDLMDQIAGYGTTSDALVQLGGYAVMAGAALRNFSEQLPLLFEKLKFLLGPIASGVEMLPKDKSLSPGAERDRFIAEAELLNRLFERRQAAAKRRGLTQEETPVEMPKALEVAEEKANRLRERTAVAVERMNGFFEVSALGGGEGLRRGATVFNVSSGSGRQRSSDLRTDLMNIIDSMISAGIQRASG